MTLHHFGPEFMLTGGQEWPDLINRLVTPSSRATTCVGFIKCKHCYIPFIFIALRAVARVNQVIPYILPEYINHVSLAWLSGGYLQQHVPLLDSVVGGGMVDKQT